MTSSNKENAKTNYFLRILLEPHANYDVCNLMLCHKLGGEEDDYERSDVHFAAFLGAEKAIMFFAVLRECQCFRVHGVERHVFSSLHCSETSKPDYSHLQLPLYVCVPARLCSCVLVCLGTYRI